MSNEKELLESSSLLNSSLDLFDDNDTENTQNISISSSSESNSPIKNTDKQNKTFINTNKKHTSLHENGNNDKENINKITENHKRNFIQISDKEPLYPSGSNVFKLTNINEPKKVRLDRSIHECPFCGIIEENSYRLQFHVETDHAEGIEILRDEGLNSKLKVMASGSPHALNMNSVDPFTCPLCDETLADADCLQVHVKESHGTELGLDDVGQCPCPICGALFPTDDDVQTHITTHSDDPVYHAVSGTSIAFTEKSVSCPICRTMFPSADLLTSHVEVHFESKSEAKDLKREIRKTSNVSYESEDSTSTAVSSSSSSKVDYKKQYEQNLERAVFKGQLSVSEFYEQKSKMAEQDLRGVDDGHSKVEGIVEKIDVFMSRHGRSGQFVLLCSPTDHYAGSYGDKGWGCGYRNFQMILSCLVRNSAFLNKMFPNGRVEIPSIPKVQEIIEAAWKKGFDVQGCRQLKGKLVNTRKWIGGTEIAATLSYLGLKTKLADFTAPSAPDGTHPKLFEWVTEYFHETSSFKPPLYLQHQGHSRTIVGVETDRGVNKLLLFDPSTPHDTMTSIAASNFEWKTMKTFRRPLSAFKAQQYQIVAVLGLLRRNEYEESKVLKSERIS